MRKPLGDEEFAEVAKEQLPKAQAAINAMIALVFGKERFPGIRLDAESDSLEIGDTGFTIMLMRTAEADLATKHHQTYWELTAAVVHSNYPHAPDDMDVVEVEEFMSLRAMVIGLMPHLARLGAEAAWDNESSSAFYEDSIPF